ncbi:hypothetical protein vseg_019325 [Gypsophila vaccaria]
MNDTKEMKKIRFIDVDFFQLFDCFRIFSLYSPISQNDLKTTEIIATKTTTNDGEYISTTATHEEFLVKNHHVQVYNETVITERKLMGPQDRSTVTKGRGGAIH